MGRLADAIAPFLPAAAEGMGAPLRRLCALALLLPPAAAAQRGVRCKACLRALQRKAGTSNGDVSPAPGWADVPIS